MKANNLQFLLSGLYTWAVTILFGAVLLDIVYANLALSSPRTSGTARMFSEIADFLLIIVAATVLTGMIAIIFSWSLGPARNTLVASISCVLLPLLFYPLIAAAQASMGGNFGMWVRLSTSALSSILAFVGLWMIHNG